MRGDAGSGRRFLPAVAAEVATVSACYDARHDPDRTEPAAAPAGPGRVLRRGDRPLPTARPRTRRQLAWRWATPTSRTSPAISISTS